LKIRRGRHEGSIFQRKDGRWCATLSLGAIGERKYQRKSFYGDTKQDVLAKLLRFRSGQPETVEREARNLTVGKFLRRWLDDAAKPKVRAKTLALYEGVVKKHIEPRLGPTPIATLSPGHVQSTYAALERDGASKRMVELVHAILHRAFHVAVRWGWMLRNPCAAVDRPRVDPKPARVLDATQVRAFLKKASKDPLHALYVLAIATGLRFGELLALRWEDVDLPERYLVVKRTMLEVGGKLEIGEPKTPAGRRRVDLPDFAVAALKKHHKAALNRKRGGSMLVFCDRNGGPLRQSNVTRRLFQPILTAAKVPTIRFHDLRHTAATLLVMQGVHPKVVQERLGHSRVDVTLDTYSHVLPSMQRDAADQLDRLSLSGRRGSEPPASRNVARA
jgi:integrase